jgi:hypothetical protein
VLSNENLAAELQRLAADAGDLAGAVAKGEDLAPLPLAAGLVEAAKLADRLGKLSRKLRGAEGNGRAPTH